jgi:hypothetical protein
MQSDRYKTKRFVEQERQAENFCLTNFNAWFEIETNEMHMSVRPTRDSVIL